MTMARYLSTWKVLATLALAVVGSFFIPMAIPVVSTACARREAKLVIIAFLWTLPAVSSLGPSIDATR